MEDKVKAFLESGKLEAYIYGNLEPKAKEEVRQFINKYPAVKKEYDDLQDQLEKISRRQSKKAPDGLKSEILQSLTEKTPQVVAKMSSLGKYLAITGLAASLLLAWGWFNSQTQIKKEIEKYETLVSECAEKQEQVESQRQQIAFLTSDKTQRVEMRGNQLAPKFNINFFINEEKEKLLLTPQKGIQLPNNKCLQLWGDLEGEMIPIAVLDDTGKGEYSLEINPDFASLNITIEERTKDGKGKLHPDVTQLISSISI
jgi:hypothetical protein